MGTTIAHANHEDHYRIARDFYESAAISGRCLDQSRALGRGDGTGWYRCERCPCRCFNVAPLAGAINPISQSIVGLISFL